MFPLGPITPKHKQTNKQKNPRISKGADTSPQLKQTNSKSGHGQVVTASSSICTLQASGMTVSDINHR